MGVCYFCGTESDTLKKCDKCLQEYCAIHEINHDCPMVPIQNPYSLEPVISEDSVPVSAPVNVTTNTETEVIDFKKGGNEEDEYYEEDEIEVDIEGVYDIEHDFADPDGYLKPDQVIKDSAPLLSHVKIGINRDERCYFCGKPSKGLRLGYFVKVRNIDEKIFKSVKKGIFGGNLDGFWLCGDPECVMKWQSNEPVYLRFKKGKVFRYRTDGTNGPS